MQGRRDILKICSEIFFCFIFIFSIVFMSYCITIKNEIIYHLSKYLFHHSMTLTRKFADLCFISLFISLLKNRTHSWSSGPYFCYTLYAHTHTHIYTYLYFINYNHTFYIIFLSYFYSKFFNNLLKKRNKFAHIFYSNIVIKYFFNYYLFRWFWKIPL